MDLTTATPTQIDAHAADTHTHLNRALARAQHTLDTLHRLAGDQRQNRTRTWTMSHDDARAAAATRHPGPAQTQERDLAEARDDAATQRAILEAIDAEFAARGGWTRFFLVKGSNGHIHSSMDCQTCNRMGKATEFAWMTDLSGQTEAQAVEQGGPILCTVCFPSAPLDWTNGHEVEQAKKQAERCSGSGRSFDPALPHRKGFASGNWGTCPECQGQVTLTSALNLRAHKPSKG